jgi:uncharacterized protein YjbI with pentapeptide repeats
MIRLRSVIQLFIIYIAQVTTIWGLVEGYTYFKGNYLKELVGPYRILLYILPLISTIYVAKRSYVDKQQELKVSRAQTEEQALQYYLDKMTELILEPNKLLEVSGNVSVQNIARSRTLTVLQNLRDAERKRSVVRFLYEAKLISVKKAIIDLSEADLSEANLSESNLSEANLSDTILCRADLSGADLYQADLSGANLREAKLDNANLGGANLFGAKLEGVDLSNTLLYGVVLEKADLSNVNLIGADLKGLYLCETNLSGANLAEANLRGTNLCNVSLVGANLSKIFLAEANLQYANLEEANLEGADLSGAKYNRYTIWPDGFKPEKAGAKLVFAGYEAIA